MTEKPLIHRLAAGFLTLLVVWLTVAAAPVLAVCEAVPGQVLSSTSIPIVYQDCVETIDTNFDSPSDSFQLLTSPNTQVGDFLVLAVVINRAPHNVTVATTAASGWSAVTVPSNMANVSNGEDGSNDVTLSVFVKTAQVNGSETLTVSATNSNNNEHAIGWVMRFSNTLGQDTTAGSFALSRPGRANNADSPSVTTSTNNSLVLRLIGVDDDDTSAVLDANILGTSSNGFANTAITMQKSGNNGNTVTAIAAYHLKAAAGAIGVSSTTSAIGGAEEYVAYTMALRPRAYFTFTHAATAQSCNMNVISIAARNTSGAVNTTYTGTITLSTRSAHGYWTKTGGDANGSLSTAGNGDGTASYTFTLSDAGTIDLVYYNPIIETINFDIVDGSGNRELKTISNDAGIILTACGISAPTQTCSAAGAYDNNGGSIGTGVGGNALFSHTIPASTTANRMVVVVYSGEDTPAVNRAAGTATFNGVAMQSIGFQRTDDGGADNYTQIFAINHAALPAATGSYNIKLANVAGDAAICAFTLTGVKQTYPTGNGTTLPVNVSGIIGNNTIATTLTPGVANSYVIVGVGNGGSGSYNARSDGLSEKQDIGIGGGGAVFSVGAGAVPGAGVFTATSVATAANRQSQVVAAFAPSGGGYFKIAHGGAAPLCGAAPVTITVADANGSPNAAYTGTITLTTSNNLGTWSAPAGSPGVFTSLGNGSAKYSFTLADAGKVVLNFTPGNNSTVNFNVTDAATPALVVSPLYDPDLAVEACQYRITPVQVSGNTCSVNAVVFSLVTTSGAPVAAYTGTIAINVSTSVSDKGTWTLNGGGSGVLVDTTPKDGAASYTFAASDKGKVTLYLTASSAAVFNFDVAGNGFNLNASFDPNYTVNKCKFIVSYNNALPADICTPQEVTIRATDPAGNTITNFSKQVIIGTTTGHGDWSTNGSQAGIFSDPSPGDGGAVYTFVPGDNGRVTLVLSAPVAETLRITVETLDGTMKVDTLTPANNPALTLALCSFRFTATDGVLSVCGEERVTLEVYNSANALAVDYTGVVNLNTSTGNGTWIKEQGANALVDPVSGDGAASYTFHTLDNGSITLVFTSDAVENLSLDAVDIQESGFRESLSFDPLMKVLTCFPTVLDTQCYRGQNQTDAISVLAAPQLESRMVLLYSYVESSDNPPTSAVLSDGVTNYPMTLIRTQTVNEVWMGVWGILGADLPVDATTLDVSYNGGPFNLPGSGARQPGMCLLALEGVKQHNLATLGSTAQVNGIALNVTGSPITSNTLTVVTKDNSSLVIGVAGNGQGSANPVSTLGVPYWHLTDSSPSSPTSAEWQGDGDVIPTPQTVSVTVSNGGAPSFYRFAHIVMALSPIIPGQPYGTSYVPVNLYKTFAGNLSYRAVGASLRAQSNYGNSCAMNSSASAVLPLPPGSSVEAAYLYWAGSGTTADIDNLVSFGPGTAFTSVKATEVFQIKTTISALTTEYFLGYKDITSLILADQPNQQYTLKDLSVRQDGNWASVSTCLGGWGMVVIFENPVVEPDVNVINLFHGFQPFQNSGFTLVPRNFRMAEPNPLTNVPRGIITHLTFEGDATINNGTEVFELQNDPAAMTFDILNNPSNLGNAQYNDTISYPNFNLIGTYNPATTSMSYITPTTTSYGTDVDTYYIAGTIPVAADPKEDILYPFGLNQSETITTRYSAGQDLVLLAGEFISVTNADLADLEVFTSTSGTFTVGSEAAGSFMYDVVNNGNNASSNGYARGAVILTSQMPAGITINSIVPPEHWSCSVAVSLQAFTCVFDIRTWANGTVQPGNPGLRQLDDTAYAASHGTLSQLPTLQVLVNVGNETAFPNISNPSSVSGRIANFASPLNCTMPAIGYQPDPTSCTRAQVFDNVNDLNKNTIDIDDLTEKTTANNNVDRSNFLIRGLRTDLAMDVSLNGVLQTGQSASYQLLISNYGPDAVSKPMTVTVTFPAGLSPNVPSPPGWSCGLSGATLTCVSDPNQLALNSGASTVITVTTGAVLANEGEFVSTTATVTAGNYNFDTVPGNNSDTEVSEVVGNVTPINDRFLLSTSETSTLGGQSFENQDLVLYDPTTDTAQLFLQVEALPGASALDLDAVHLLPNGWVVFSSKDAGTLGGISFEDEDLVLYDPILGQAQILFDGSDPDKFGTQTAADIDAVYVAINNSYAPADWTLYLSLASAANLNSVAIANNDIATYAMTGGATSIVFKGSDAGKFGGTSGDIGGFYVRDDDPSVFILTTNTTSAAVTLETESYTSDDLVSYDTDAAPGSRASQIFDGAQAPGIFTPVSATRIIDAIHVVEDRYYGHFAINTVDGTTCSMGRVTVRKHGGLTHAVDTLYQGSIRLQASSASANWFADASNSGTLQNLGGGLAIYTFAPADQGVAVLGLAESSPSLNVGINVTNGIATENSLEDLTLDISAALIAVNYLDEFSVVSYSASNGLAGWSSNWSESGDDNVVSTGDVKISNGKLRLRDTNADNPALQRSIDFDFTPNTAEGPLTLGFLWGRSGGSTTDTFQAQYSLNSGAWITVGTWGAANSGVVPENGVLVNLTAAGLGIVDGDNLRIRFRVSSGLMLDVVSIDNVEIKTTTDSDCSPGAIVDHYHITNSGSLVSCLADTVTFTAHDSAHNAVEPGVGVQLTINTTTGKGSWTNLIGGSLSTTAVSNNGLAIYQWGAGESSVSLPFNYTAPETDGVVVGFDVFDSAGVSAELGSSITVNKAGLYFYNQTLGNTTWPTLVSGMDSLLYTGQTLVVKAVRASDNDPAMCVPLFDAGVTLPLQLVFECENPQTCSASNVQVGVSNNSNSTAVNTVDSNGAAGINPADVAEYSTVNLLFEDFGGGDIGARLQLTYPDAGIVQLHGRYNIPFNESVAGTYGFSGDYLTGSGNAFVVRPFGYGIDVLGDFDGNPGNEYDRLTTANANAGDFSSATSWATTAAGSAFLSAGSNFSVTVKAVSWQAADDADNNGVPDTGAFLFDNALTPNYGRELIASSNDVTLSSSLVGPVGGNQGTLSGGSFALFADAGAQTNALSWSEVGIIDLVANLDGAGGYLDSGQGITGAALNVGRFYPAYFEVTATSLVPRPALSTGASAFTYMGEAFEVGFTVTARNAAGNVTENYRDGFAKLSNGAEGANQLSFYAVADQALAADVDYSARVARDSGVPFSSDFTAHWGSGTPGQVSLTGNLVFNRQSSGVEDGPLTALQIALRLQDSDGVVETGRNVDLDDGLTEPGLSLYTLLGSQEFRYARLVLDNAYGSELIDYWDHDNDDGVTSPEVPRNMDVAMPFYIEYYNGSTFTINTDDDLSRFSIANLIPVAGSYNLGLVGSGFDNLDAGEFINVDTNSIGGISTLADGQTLETNGSDLPFYFRAPGEGNDGSVIMEFDLDAAGLSFLQYDWRSPGQLEDQDADNDYSDNPRAVLEFGTFSGNDRIINWQELFISP